MEEESNVNGSNVNVRRRTSRTIATIALLLTSLLLLSVAAQQLLHRRKITTGIAPLPDSAQVIVEDVLEPNEAKPNDNDYKVPADQPRIILIPKTNTRGPIQRVGITKDNAIAVPTNVHFAGWYISSDKPGDDGLSIIDGHVSGKYTDGIFKSLSTLVDGDDIVIEYGNGTKKEFKVVEVKTLPEQEAGDFLLIKREDIGRQLNLITCGGIFNRDTQRYADRTIVVAKSVN